jgi:hypothetical protein
MIGAKIPRNITGNAQRLGGKRGGYVIVTPPSTTMVCPVT